MNEVTQAMPEKPTRSASNLRPEDASGRTGGGESGGGAYREKDQVPTEPGSFNGGQSNKTYHGPGDQMDGNTNPNAVADSE